MLLRVTCLFFVIVFSRVGLSEHRLFYYLPPPIFDIIKFLVPHLWVPLPFTTMEHLPASESWSIFKSWRNLLAYINYSDLFDVSGDSCCHYCFIFYRVEGASRINKPSSLFEQLEASFQDIELKRMVGMPHMVVEVLPQTIILPECAVSTARNIAQNPVEFEHVLLIVNFEVWQESSVILGNKQ